MKLESLHDLFALKVMALYDIESEIVKALPKMARAATDPDLKEGFEEHLEETKSQVERLTVVFDELGIKPKKTKVQAIRGLVEDAEWLIKEEPSEAALDAGLIASARYVEHYEMAGYLSAVVWAKLLGYTEAAKLLQATLEEEKMAEEKLSELAEESVNQKAMIDPEENENMEDEDDE
jgi:ferritin-like metal-binding protein YciE